MPHSELSLFGDIQRNSSFQVLYLLRFASLRSPALGEIVHVSRHTMATEVCMTNGVPIETVSSILGHKSIKTTQVYAKITKEKLNNDMEKLSDRLSDIKEFSIIETVCDTARLQA